MADDLENKSDEEIAVLIKTGNEDALKVMIERYQPKMMRYANKFLYLYEDRQDAVSEVFIKTYQNIQSFDESRSFSSWIYKIAHNNFINFIKKKGREALPLIDPDTFFAVKVPDEAEIKNREISELREVLDSILEKISIKYREILVLYYYEDKTYDEIAEILEIPKNTVGVRLKRARIKMKELYERE